MDTKTTKILRENPEFDTPVDCLVRLLASAKASREYGETGLVCTLRGGLIVEQSRIQRFTDQPKAG